MCMALTSDSKQIQNLMMAFVRMCAVLAWREADLYAVENGAGARHRWRLKALRT